MAMLRTLVGLAVTGMLINVAMATSYTVGSPNGGWDLTTNLQGWASSQSFSAGDSLGNTHQTMLCLKLRRLTMTPARLVTRFRRILAPTHLRLTRLQLLHHRQLPQLPLHQQQLLQTHHGLPQFPKLPLHQQQLLQVHRMLHQSPLFPHHHLKV
ncbi:hypothetical protein CsSME_00027094 [Camellia sinensis var. sinensis]